MNSATKSKPVPIDTSLRNGKSLRFQAIAATSLIILAILTLAGWSLERSYQHHQRLATETTVNLSQVLLQQIGTSYANADGAILALIDEIQRESGRTPPSVRHIESSIQKIIARNPELVSLRVVDALGETRYGYGGHKAPAGSNVADRDYFIRHQANPHTGLIVTGPLQGRISGKWGLLLSRRLNDGSGTFAGVVVANLSLEEIKRHFASLKLNPNDSIALRNDQLAIISRYPETGGETVPGATKVSTDFQEALKRNPEMGTYTSGSTSIDAISRIHTYRRHPIYPFIVNVGKSRTDFLTLWETEASIAGIIVLIFGSTLIFGVFALLRSWRQQAEKAQKLAESDGRFQAIIEATPIPLGLNDAASNITYLNAAFTRTFGYTRDDIPTLEAWWSKAYPDPTYRLQIVQAWSDSLAKAKQNNLPCEPIEARIRCKNGQDVVALVGADRLNGFSDEIYLVTLYDITDRKQAELQLQHYRDDLEQLVEERTKALSDTQFALNRAGIGIHWVDASTGRFLYVNDRAAEMLGYTTDEMLQFKVPDLDPNFPPGDFREITDAIFADGTAHFESALTHRNGTLIPIELVGYVFPEQEGRPRRFITFISDITQRKKQAQAILDAKLAAESANFAKSRFLANMSHEIRTPMNAIIGMTHLLRRTINVPEQSEKLEKISAAADHLLGIINDILDISKIEANKVVLEKADFDLDALLSRIRAMVIDRAHEKKLELELDAPPNIGLVNGDATRLTQAILNYLGNAIKFTEQGSITLRVRILEKSEHKIQIRIEVEDTGIGIPPDAMGRLFHSFEQADNTTTRRYGGTGLGLAITKRLAQLMGGDAGATSKPGSGSTFWMTVCLDTVNQAIPHLQMHELHLAPSALLETHDPSSSDTENSIEKLKQRYRHLRILLVEDEPINQEVAREILEDIGWTVEVACNGREAVELVRNHFYDLILMDMQMPVLGGVDAAREIRQLPNGKSIPIIALTANAFSEDREACQKAGMNDYLAKPVIPTKLFDTLLKWLSRE